MGGEIPVYWVARTGRAQLRLRRFCWSHDLGTGDAGEKCPAAEWGSHDASAEIGETGITITPYERYEAQGARGGFASDTRRTLLDPDVAEPPHDDPRWPAVCACGYRFLERDEWQLYYDDLYEGFPDGQRHPIGAAHANKTPVGALWRAWFSEDLAIRDEERGLAPARDGTTHGFRKGPDGMTLSVQTPGGEWCIDQTSTSGSYWTRTAVRADHQPGDRVTELVCSPSILMPRYHGFLGGSDGSKPGILVEC